jgi:hypothetical protein
MRVGLLDILSFGHRVEHESRHGSDSVQVSTMVDVKDARHSPLGRVGVLLDSLLLLLLFFFFTL